MSLVLAIPVKCPSCGGFAWKVFVDGCWYECEDCREFFEHNAA